MSREPDKKHHTLADHRYGVDAGHAHGEDGALDHDHDDPDGDAAPVRDHLNLTSVGIDIGSSGTQVIFSRIELRRPVEAASSRCSVVTHETLFQSPVALTPYRDEQQIDEEKLAAIIDEAYNQAGLHPDRVDSGVVILTGAALRRENARAISDSLAEASGEFVCAGAGHHLEAMLAAYGSGAVRVSREEGKRILNVDIGGGTTKLAVASDGEIIATAAVNIGGRLQVTDENGTIVRLDPAGRRHAAVAGFAWNVGEHVRRAEMAHVAETMADALIAAIHEPRSIEPLYLTDPIPDPGRIDGVMFSGGVGEYVYGREERDFGDMGKLLGAAVARRLADGALPWPLLPPGECIRATAAGAARYGMQPSGSAFYISSPGDLLPRKNLQVLQPSCAFRKEIDSGELASAIRGRFAAFDLEEGAVEVALAFRWLGEPSHSRIAALARGIVEGLPCTIASGKPLYLVIDGDIAQPLGKILKEEHRLANEVLAIDGVALRDLDYIDLGRIRLPSHTVPVTIKSLVFSEDPRHPHDPGIQYRPHHGPGHHHYHEYDHVHGHGHPHSDDHDHASVRPAKS